MQAGRSENEVFTLRAIEVMESAKNNIRAVAIKTPDSSVRKVEHRDAVNYLIKDFIGSHGGITLATPYFALSSLYITFALTIKTYCLHLTHSPRALAQTPSAGALLLLDVLSIKNFAPFVYGRREIFLKEIELGR